MEILDDVSNGNTRRCVNMISSEFVVHICGFRFDSLAAQPVNRMIPQTFGTVLDSSADYWRKI